MEMREWYEELLSQTEGFDFTKGLIPDIFRVVVHEGDKVYAEWDITDELFEQGMARRNFTNASLDIDAELVFIHRDIKEEFHDDEAFQEMWQQALNDSAKFHNVTTSVYHMRVGGGVYVRYYIQAALTLLIGLIGLALKVKASDQTRIVKVTKIAYSIWCIVIGILMSVFEYSRYRAFSESEDLDPASALILINCIVNVLLKVCIMSLKVFTVMIYAFQNTMLYRPFFFRENKKVLSRWLLRASLGQSSAIFAGFTIWSMFLLLKDDVNCAGIVERSDSWQIAITSMIGIGYIGSLVLSIVFTEGYYRQNTKDMGKSEANDIKKTMLACSIEIMFDFSVVIVHAASPLNFLTFDIQPASLAQPHLASKCHTLVRLSALNSRGLARDTICFLALQPTVQELFFLIFALVDHCKRRSP